MTAGIEIKKMFLDLQTKIDQADATLRKASKLGMEVGEAQMEQTQARDDLTKARVTLHSFEVARVKRDVEAANKVANKNEQAGLQALLESKYRRMAQRPTIDFIDTYSAAYRLDVFETAGGFDEALQVDEDQELSFRLAEAGARLVFAPEAVVYHRHVATPLAYMKRKFRIGYWKVLVAAMHPARIITDSHTPQSLKAQMALLALVLLLLPAASFSRLARKALAIAAGTLLATTLPIAARIAADE